MSRIKLLCDIEFGICHNARTESNEYAEQWIWFSPNSIIAFLPARPMTRCPQHRQQRELTAAMNLEDTIKLRPSKVYRLARIVLIPQRHACIEKACCSILEHRYDYKYEYVGWSEYSHVHRRSIPRRLRAILWMTCPLLLVIGVALCQRNATAHMSHCANTITSIH